MKTLIKQSISRLAAVALAAIMTFGLALHAQADAVSYVAADGSTQTASNLQEISSSSNLGELSMGFYYVSENVTHSGTIDVKGNVTIILKQGVAYTVAGAAGEDASGEEGHLGLKLANDAMGTTGSLTITTEPGNNPGNLVVTGGAGGKITEGSPCGNGGAAVGQADYSQSAAFTVWAGNVTLRGGEGGQGEICGNPGPAFHSSMTGNQSATISMSTHEIAKAGGDSESAEEVSHASNMRSSLAGQTYVAFAPKPPVAKRTTRTGETSQYVDFDAALAAAESGDTVTLLANVTASSVVVPETVTLDLNKKTLTVLPTAVTNNGTIVVYDIKIATALSNNTGTLKAGENLVQENETGNVLMSYPAGTTITLTTETIESAEHVNICPTVKVNVPAGDDPLTWKNGVGPYKQMFVTSAAQVIFGGNIDYSWWPDHKTLLSVTGDVLLASNVSITNNAAMEVVGTISPNGSYKISLDALNATLTNPGKSLVANRDVVTAVEGYAVVEKDGVYSLKQLKKLSNVEIVDVATGATNATAKVYVGGQEVTQAADGSYSVPEDTPIDITYTVTDNALFGTCVKTKQMTMENGIAVDCAMTDDDKKAIADTVQAAWVEGDAGREIALDTRERIIITAPEEVLPIAYSTNKWGAYPEATWSKIYTNHNCKGVFLVSARENGYKEWFPQTLGTYDFAQKWSHQVGTQPESNCGTNYATICYTQPYALTWATPVGGTLAVTLDGAAVSSGDNVLGYSYLNLAATPADRYEFAGWTATAGTFTNTESLVTRFEMPNSEATIAANFQWTSNYTDRVNVKAGETWQVFAGETYSNANGNAMLAKTGSHVFGEGARFAGSTAKGAGAGCYFVCGTFAFTNATFSGNQAFNGGAMMIYGTTGSLVRCSLAGNTANEKGGAAYVMSATLRLEDSTFNGNSATTYADAGALYIDAESVVSLRGVNSFQTATDAIANDGALVWNFTDHGEPLVDTHANITNAGTLKIAFDATLTNGAYTILRLNDQAELTGTTDFTISNGSDEKVCTIGAADWVYVGLKRFKLAKDEGVYTLTVETRLPMALEFAASPVAGGTVAVALEGEGEELSSPTNVLERSLLNLAATPTYTGTVRYEFTGWTATTNGVAVEDDAFGDQSALVTTFEMPSAATELAANFQWKSNYTDTVVTIAEDEVWEAFAGEKYGVVTNAGVLNIAYSKDGPSLTAASFVSDLTGRIVIDLTGAEEGTTNLLIAAGAASAFGEYTFKAGMGEGFDLVVQEKGLYAAWHVEPPFTTDEVAVNFAWTNKVDGETVTLAGKDYTFGVDAFTNAQAAVDVAKKRLVFAGGNGYEFPYGNVSFANSPAGGADISIGTDGNKVTFNAADGTANKPGQFNTDKNTVKNIVIEDNSEIEAFSFQAYSANTLVVGKGCKLVASGMEGVQYGGFSYVANGTLDMKPGSSLTLRNGIWSNGKAYLDGATVTVGGAISRLDQLALSNGTKLILDYVKPANKVTPVWPRFTEVNLGMDTTSRILYADTWGAKVATTVDVSGEPFDVGRIVDYVGTNTVTYNLETFTTTGGEGTWSFENRLDDIYVVRKGIYANPSVATVADGELGEPVEIGGKTYHIGFNAFTTLSDFFASDYAAQATNIDVHGCQTLASSVPTPPEQWNLNLVPTLNEKGEEVLPILTIGTDANGNLCDLGDIASISGKGSFVLSTTNEVAAAEYKTMLDNLAQKGGAEIGVASAGIVPVKDGGGNVSVIVDDQAKPDAGTGAVIVPGIENLLGNTTIAVVSEGATTNDVYLAGNVVTPNGTATIINQTTNSIGVAGRVSADRVEIVNTGYDPMTGAEGAIIAEQPIVAKRDVEIDNRGHLAASVTAGCELTIRNASIHTLVGTYAGAEIELTGDNGALSGVTFTSDGPVAMMGTNILTGSFAIFAPAGATTNFGALAWSVKGANTAATLADLDAIAAAESAQDPIIYVDYDQARATYVLASNATTAAGATFRFVETGLPETNLVANGDWFYPGDSRGYMLEVNAANQLVFTVDWGVSAELRAELINTVTTNAAAAVQALHDLETLTPDEIAARTAEIETRTAQALAFLAEVKVPAAARAAVAAALAACEAELAVAEAAAEGMVRFEQSQYAATAGTTLVVRVYGGSVNRSTAATLSYVSGTCSSRPKAYVDGKRVSFPIALNWAKGDRTPREVTLQFSKTVQKTDRFFTLQLGSEVASTVGALDVATVTVAGKAADTVPYVRALAWPANGGKVSGSGNLRTAKAARTLQARANKWATFAGWYRAKADDPNAIDIENGLVTRERKLKVAQAEAGTYYAYFTDMLPVIAVNDLDLAAATGVTSNGTGGVIGSIGLNVSLPIGFTVAEGDTSGQLKVSHLPRGLKFNRKTGLVTGVPSKAGTYEVRIQGKNLAGKHILVIPFEIREFPPVLVGTFAGTLTDANQSAVGSARVTVTKGGKITVRLTCRTDRYTLTTNGFVDGAEYDALLEKAKVGSVRLTIGRNAAGEMDGTFTGVASGEKFGATPLAFTATAED